MHKVVLMVLGGIGIVFSIALGRYLKLSAMSQRPPDSVNESPQVVDQIDSNDSTEENALSLGRLLGCNQPAPPPVAFYVGPAPGDADAPDLSTPSAAVYSVLSLIEQDATDKLAPCFVVAPENPQSDLFPRYLGHPMELVEAIEESESAEVVWKATVHTGFSLDSRGWSPGESITLTSRLVMIDGLWKLSTLHD